MTAELHCHTLFSVDGRGTPESLVDVAAERKITTLAVTEHNHLGSSERARQRASERGIRTISGVELDAEWKERRFHFLAFGFNLRHAPLRNLIAKNFSNYVLDRDLFVKHLARLGYSVTVEQINDGLIQRYSSHPAPVFNRWFARDFVVANSIVPDRETFHEVFRQIEHEIAIEPDPQNPKRFSTLHETRDAVHRAGGVLLLAHVAHYHPGDLARQIKMIHEAVDEGLDGFELYHPRNLAEPHFDRLAHEAEKMGCAVSGGSDCHDALEDSVTGLGCAEVPDQVVEQLEAALARRRG